MAVPSAVSTTYRSTDYAQPSGKYELPLHHPRFLGWIGAPESASLLDRGPSEWLHSLYREQAIDVARQLHRDVCLMTTNLNVLDQYVLCLQGTASEILELSLGSQDFPSAAVAAGAKGPRVRRASVHMEAMGLWRSSLDPAIYPWIIRDYSYYWWLWLSSYSSLRGVISLLE